MTFKLKPANWLPVWDMTLKLKPANWLPVLDMTIKVMHEISLGQFIAGLSLDLSEREKFMDMQGEGLVLIFYCIYTFKTSPSAQNREK